MSTLADASIVLEHRRWLAAPRVAKVLFGTAGLAGGGVVLAGGVPAQPSLAFTAGWTLATVLLIIGGAWLAFDGITDLLSWRRLRRLRRPSIQLDASGLHYHDEGEAGAITVSVPWHEVRRCAVRPGFGGNRFLCFDAPGWYPEPPAAEIGDVIVDPDAVRARAHAWSMTVCPDPLPPAERNLLITSYVLGTPFAVDLTTCRGVDRAHLDRALFGWTGGRCRLSG